MNLEIKKLKPEIPLTPSIPDQKPTEQTPQQIIDEIVATRARNIPLRDAAVPAMTIAYNKEVPRQQRGRTREEFDDILRTPGNLAVTTPREMAHATYPTRAIADAAIHDAQDYQAKHKDVRFPNSVDDASLDQQSVVKSVEIIGQTDFEGLHSPLPNDPRTDALRVAVANSRGKMPDTSLIRADNPERVDTLAHETVHDTQAASSGTNLVQAPAQTEYEKYVKYVTGSNEVGARLPTILRKYGTHPKDEKEAAAILDRAGFSIAGNKKADPSLPSAVKALHAVFNNDITPEERKKLLETMTKVLPGLVNNDKDPEPLQGRIRPLQTGSTQQKSESLSRTV